MKFENCVFVNNPLITAKLIRDGSITTSKIEKNDLHDNLFESSPLSDDEWNQMYAGNSKADFANVKPKDDMQAEWEKDNSTLTIPELPDAKVWADGGPYPFETVEDVEHEIFLACCEKIDNSRRRFDVVGPRQFTYRGRTIKYIGMETYLLEAVRITYDVKTGRSFRFYFKAVDAGVSIKLYDISENEAGNMFGSDLLNWMAQLCEETFKSQMWVDVRAAVQSAQDIKRYKGTGMDFGGWA